MSILVVPSLENKRFILMQNISLSEAESFIDHFDENVQLNRKCNRLSQSPGNRVIFSGLFEKSRSSINLDGAELSALLNANDAKLSLDEVDNYVESINTEIAIANSIKLSNVSGVRGARAVYVDLRNNVVVVGTTVVYNKNRASLNFDGFDSDELEEIFEEIYDNLDSDEDLDEDSDNLNYWDESDLR